MNYTQTTITATILLCLLTCLAIYPWVKRTTRGGSGWATGAAAGHLMAFAMIPTGVISAIVLTVVSRHAGYIGQTITAFCIAIVLIVLWVFGRRRA